MAQPIFDDEHPLEEYFRRAGESNQVMPGGVTDFTEDQASTSGTSWARTYMDRLTSFLTKAYQLACFRLVSRSSPENTFAERFKYDVISSSLLSVSIAAPPCATRRTFYPELPGRPDDESNQPVPPGSIANSNRDLSCTQTAFAFTGLQWPIFWVSLTVIALAAEYYFLSIFLLGGAVSNWHALKTNREKASATTSTLHALSELISAGNIWDSAVTTAITIIEREERSIFYGPTSPQSPSSGLRVTLQSSLHTTQVQCDNVRQLLSALTDPSQLAQLSEMYAPASPIKPAFSILDHPRPMSVPAWRQSTTSMPSSKRATWNGSYASLALTGSPAAQILKRRRTRRSDLSTLLNMPNSRLASVSAPASPQFATPLEGVQEEDDRVAPETLIGNDECFGAAALDLQRRRKSAGMETFRISLPSYSSQVPQTPPADQPAYVSTLPATTSSSRFTPLHTTRHPLSLSGLNLALHGALSAKRFACSHLLALRFEDEDDSYWEDVRSVMALLTSTFEDASSRLMEALDVAEKKRIKDERPSPDSQASHSRAASLSPTPLSRTLRSVQTHHTRTMAEMVSFAPMPSTLTRFAAHVDAISSSLNDARKHLEQCVASLCNSASSEDDDCEVDVAPTVQEHPAFQAYDRLRKELGFALRECERGRERLLDIVAGAQSTVIAEDVNPFVDDTPALGLDTGSDTSDRPGPSSPASHQPDIPGLRGIDGELGLKVSTDHGDEDLDDATTHLLLTTSSHHLPPPGLEQVFEADTGGIVPFTRERSKLSREDRIRLAKTRRDSGRLASMTLSEPSSKPSEERWAPGGEVVQELKDVIWKVGERRRRMAEQPGACSELPILLASDTDKPQSPGSLS
ncbi:hypothetical protein AcV7_003100 [Taiwanofungus camphoratus]|nr:hypothetical protein AcV7_003100 [Antrodia cinnamomea]